MELVEVALFGLGWRDLPDRLEEAPVRMLVEERMLMEERSDAVEYAAPFVAQRSPPAACFPRRACRSGRFWPSKLSATTYFCDAYHLGRSAALRMPTAGSNNGSPAARTWTLSRKTASRRSP
jgi:hypothetical protein